MSNIRKQGKVTIRLGTETVALDYSMASIHYLAEKHGDLTKLFEREGNAIDADFVNKVADVVYAGLLAYDDDGKDTSGWTPMKVMSRLHLNQMDEIMEAFSRGMSFSMPEGDGDPTKTETAKEGA